MPDIREIIKALSPEDHATYMEARNNLRANYLHTHSLTVGIGSWNVSDDAFFDLIDITLATLFDRAGKIKTAAAVAKKEELKEISDALEKNFSEIGKTPEPQTNETAKSDVATNYTAQAVAGTLDAAAVKPWGEKT